MAGVYGGLVGRNVSRSEEKVALRYVRGEDLGIYGSGARAQATRGTLGLGLGCGLRGQGRAQVTGQAWGPFHVDMARGREPWVSLRISLLKGPCTERRGVQHQDLRGWGQQAGGPAAPTGHAAVGSGGGCRERVLARLPFCFSPEGRLGPGAPTPAPPRVRRCP